jgi:hypothetical protein
LTIILPQCILKARNNSIEFNKFEIHRRNSSQLGAIPTFVTKAMSASSQHRELGELKSNIVDGTAQFLGLKYATLKNRLAPAQLSKYGRGPTDATKYG